MVQKPFDLGPGKIRIKDQSCALFDQRFKFLKFFILTNIGGPAALPDDGAPDRKRGLAVPHNGCLPLIRNTDGQYLLRSDPGLTDRLFDHRPAGRPYLLGIMLDPPWLGIILAELLIRTGDDLPPR